MASILVIDYGPNIRSLLRTALEDAGRTVVEAVNGREGQPWTATVSGFDCHGHIHTGIKRSRPAPGTYTQISQRQGDRKLMGTGRPEDCLNCSETIVCQPYTPIAL